MATWLAERRLAQNGARLAERRHELAQIDEQFSVVSSEADDQALRALVSETPLAEFEAADARRHASALDRHRQHLLAEIADLERRQDELLDRIAAATR